MTSDSTTNDPTPNEEHLGRPLEVSTANALAESPAESANDESTKYERIIPRLLRNMLLFSLVLLGPAFWFYGWAGALGFACGSAVSYVNFRSLKLGVEGLADRVVNRDSPEKGGLIVFRFVVRYGLVGAAAYAIFKGSSTAFRGFLWGLCVPVAALMAEAVWEGYTVFRPKS
jgi:hypothetical protein